MSEHKTISIRLSLEEYERLENISPRKHWGQNSIHDLYRAIFLQGMESPLVLKKEKQQLERIIAKLGQQLTAIKTVGPKVADAAQHVPEDGTQERPTTGEVSSGLKSTVH